MKTFETNSQAFFISMGGVRIPKNEANRNGVGQRTKKAQFKRGINPLRAERR